MLFKTQHKMRGTSLTETLIILPVFLMLTLGTIQYSLIYEAKSSLNYATFMSARAGAVDHARKNAITTGLAKSISPLYSPGKDAASLIATIAKARVDVVAFTQIKILNPTQEAFKDFGVQNTKKNLKEIPNEMLHVASTKIGRASKINIQDANLLKVQVLYGYKLKVPFVNKVITTISSWFTRDPIKLGYLSQGRLPILATSTVRMQSRAWNNSWVTKTGDVNKAVTDAGNPEQPLVLASIRPWTSGPTGQGNPSQITDPGTNLNGGGSSGNGNNSGNADNNPGTGNGNPATCGGNQTTSQATSTQGTNGGNPIHIVTGNKYQHAIDIKPLPGELGIQFSRHYNSQTTYSRTMGYGWSHTYDLDFEIIDNATIRLRQPDGRVLYFNRQQNNTYTAQQASDGKLRKSDNGYGYDWVWNNGRTFKFTNEGQLNHIVEKNGQTLDLHYIGNQLQKVIDPSNRALYFSYYKTGRLKSITDPAGQKYRYQYDVNNNLILVKNPKKDRRLYHYNDKNDINNLTGITDERGIRYATWVYDDQDRAILSKHADDVQKVSLQFLQGKTKVTNSQGVTSTYQTKIINNVPLVTRVDGPGCSTCGVGDVEYKYNDSLQLVKTSSKDGHVKINKFDKMGRRVSYTEIVNGKQKTHSRYEYSGDHYYPDRIIQPSVNPNGRHVTEYTYNSQGQILGITEKGHRPDVNGGYKKIDRRITLEYDNNRLVKIDGPRNDVKDIQQFKYNEQNELVEVKRPHNIIERILAYDDYRRPVKIQYKKEIPLELQYNGAGNIVSVKQGQRIIKFAYNKIAKLKSVTDAAGVMYSIEYDNAARPYAIRDKQNNIYAIKWDTEGNETRQTTYDSKGHMVKTIAYIYNARSRLEGIIAADGRLVEQNKYDDLGRLVKNVQTAGASTTYTYGQYGNIQTIMTASTQKTQYRYDIKEHITDIVDPNGNETNYRYDDFNNLIMVTSPDSGITQYEYDRSGNVISKTDAKNQLTNYRYDANGNLISKIASKNATQYYYHNGNIAKITSNGNGNEEYYAYNQYAQLTEHKRIIDGYNFITHYKYDDITGQLIEKTLPDKQRLRYHYDKQTGKLRAITRKDFIGQTPILGELQYQPFGPVKSYLHGNGIKTSKTYDSGGALTSIAIDKVQQYEYRYDASGNIAHIKDNTTDEYYQYNTTRNLTHANNTLGTFNYQYDENGNRISKQAPAFNNQTTHYTYSKANNRLQHITDNQHVTHEYDAVGNPLRLGKKTYRYDMDNRPLQLYINGKLTAQYLYNAMGQRIKKTVYHGAQSATRYYLYENNKLVAEADQSGVIQLQYLYQGYAPYALLQQDRIYAVHTDHIGTPRALTNENGDIVWSANYTPFGKARIITADIEFNIRFPGQYEDQETGTYYNIKRTYDPDTGRYLTVDPIGQLDGLNPYLYVSANPVKYADPLGLAKLVYYGIEGTTFLPPTGGPAARWAFNISDIKKGTYKNVDLLYDKGGSYLSSFSNPNQTLSDYMTWNNKSRPGLSTKVMNTFSSFYGSRLYSPAFYTITISDKIANQLLTGLIGSNGDLQCTKLTGKPLSQLLSSITFPDNTKIKPVQLVFNYKVQGTPITITPAGGRTLQQEIAYRKAQWKKVARAFGQGGVDLGILVKAPPKGDALIYLQIYFMSDIGLAKAVAINNQIDAGIKKGYLDANGNYTANCLDVSSNIECTTGTGGKVAYRKFVIEDGSGASGNTNLIKLPSFFKGPKGNGRYEKNQLLSPLAVINHEFGHTRYGVGVPAKTQPISYEVGVMDRFESPVRLQYGYQPRRTYTDSTSGGVTTTPGATAPSALYP